MKRSKLIRFICLVMMACMLCSNASAASQVQPRYQKIVAISSELHGISTAGRATCCGSVMLMDTTCDIELYVELQQSEDGVNGWDTIKDWSSTGNEFVSIEAYWYVESGYYYRVLTSAIIYTHDGAFIESTNLDSAIFYH